MRRMHLDTTVYVRTPFVQFVVNFLNNLLQICSSHWAHCGLDKLSELLMI